MKSTCDGSHGKGNNIGSRIDMDEWKCYIRHCMESGSPLEVYSCGEYNDRQER